jgi:hypothetical protein
MTQDVVSRRCILPQDVVVGVFLGDAFFAHNHAVLWKLSTGVLSGKCDWIFVTKNPTVMVGFYRLSLV